MLLYDNLEDAKAKLSGSLCYYDGKAIIIKDVCCEDPDGEKITLIIAGRNCNKSKVVPLDDPRLNITRFNIGYCNRPEFATWWYRTPIKQYHQGLKANQMKGITSNPEFRGVDRFEFSDRVARMMENIYPEKDNCEKLLKDGEALSVAFHKNFGVSSDKMHRDLILEYKGRQIGTTKNFKDFDLLEENRYLTEALREALC